MEEKEIRKWLRFAKKHGLAEFSVNGLHFRFTEEPKALVHKNSKPSLDKTTDPALLKDDPTAAMPADSDLLFWSTDAFDVITETRKETEPRK